MSGSGAPIGIALAAVALVVGAVMLAVGRHLAVSEDRQADEEQGW